MDLVNSGRGVLVYLANRKSDNWSSWDVNKQSLNLKIKLIASDCGNQTIQDCS